MPDPIAVPLAYPMPKGSEDLTEFVSTWIALQRDSRKLDHLFDHWILGKGAEKKQPRWSVIRNVLGWVE